MARETLLARDALLPLVGEEKRLASVAAIDAAKTTKGGLVIGGDCGALGIVRSLGSAGIPAVFLIGKNSVAAYSRFTRQSSRWPGAEDPGAITWLLAFAKQHSLQGWTLFPNADDEVRLIAQNHEALRDTFTLCTPPWGTTRWLADKSLTYTKAAEVNVSFPRTYRVEDLNSPSSDVRFPLILKPAIKVGLNALTQSKVWRVDDRDALARLLDSAVAMAGPGGLIVQELIPGDGRFQFSYAAVCQDGTPIVSMVARRIRQHPANYGTGTYVETVENETVECEAEKLLKAVRYSGMVEIEFKFDARDASYKLLDANPRAWTWNSIGKVAGVDFPLAMWRISQGEPVARVRARPGAAWMYVSRDFPEAFREMVSGDLSLTHYLKSFTKPMAFAAFAWHDPLPGVADWPISLKRLFSRKSKS